MPGACTVVVPRELATVTLNVNIMQKLLKFTFYLFFSAENWDLFKFFLLHHLKAESRHTVNWLYACFLLVLFVFILIIVCGDHRIVLLEWMFFKSAIFLSELTDYYYQRNIHGLLFERKKVNEIREKIYILNKFWKAINFCLVKRPFIRVIKTHLFQRRKLISTREKTAPRSVYSKQSIYEQTATC